jgi:hypothetical protein
MKICITLLFLFLTCIGLAQDTTVTCPGKDLRYSFGGEARFQYFNFKNQDWGEAPPDKDGFILARYLAHADLQAGRHLRAFVELQSSLSSGQVSMPSPVDENTLDLHQAYLDYSAQSGHGKIIFKAGRQELTYGSQRLIAVREGPNNRQSFDAGKLTYGADKIKLDLFYANYVTARSNIFDDRFSNAIRLWGAYSTFNKLPLIQNLDVYYLAINKRTATFNEGKGKEIRHSLGARAFKNSTTWRYDLEGLYQFGNFNTSDISAWTLSSNISYAFAHATFQPQAGLKIEAISGDKNRADGRLNTFNPLFPRGAYFGLAALIGPSNLFDIHPYVQLSLSKNLVFAVDYDLFWRMSRNDGLYAVNGKMIYAGEAGTSKEIGRQLGASLEFPIGKYVDFKQEFTWFNAGDYIKQAGPGKDILMTGSTLAYKF